MQEAAATASSSQRSSSNSAVVSVLGGEKNGSSGHASAVDEPNTDDAPTVITRPLHGIGAAAPLSRAALAGRRLGHFELIEAIGSGGMAAVIKARDLELGRIVALKILPPEAAQDAESIARFKQEARAAALLDHENIARVYFCGEDQGLHFIAFEFVEGENLRTLIERRGPLPAAECVHYLLQVAAGLHHAWERGVVHRDIKPSNIIITPDGRAKIVDMGLARLYDAATDGGMTQSGVTLGTFDYISPEQALDPRRTDVRSDIYSLGCTFYHALTGRPPVAEGTAAKKLYAHQHLDPIDPRLLNPAIPDELAIILARMMAKDPARRYQTPLELIADLKGLAERWQLSVEMSDTAVQAAPATPALLPRPWPVSPIWLGVLTMAVLLAVLLGWNRTIPPGEIPPPDWAVVEGPPLPPSPPADRPPPAPEQPVLATEAVQVRTVEELVQAFRNNRVRQIIVHPGIYDLSRWREPLIARMNHLEIVGMETGESRIRLRASSTMAIDAPPRAGTLTIQAETFSARRISWEIVPGEAEEAAELEEGESGPAGLVLKEVHKAQFQDCIFRTRVPPEHQGATLVCLAGDKPPQLHLERCVLAASGYPRAGIGVLLPFGSQVEVEDSGFGPHLSALRFLPPLQPEDEESVPSLVQLSRSSFFVDRRSAVIGAAGPCRVRAGYCVFAAPAPPLRPEYNGAVLTVPAVAGISYEGTARNAYYAVQPLAVGTEGAQRLWSFDECRAQGWPVRDPQAERLSRPPWSENRPLQRLESAEPWPAFRLRIEQEAALFVRDRVKVIGAQFRDESFGFRAYPQLVAFPLPPKEGSSAPGEPRQLVWQPHAPEGEPLPPGTAADLSTLLRQARPDDTILIRHDGLLAFDHTELLDLRSRASGGGEFKITFKPYPKSRPVLTIDPANRSLDQFLFQLRAGEVEFVELQFLLKPSLPQNGLQTAAALSLLHGRGCTFDRCVFTLLEEGDAKAAVLHAGDPDKIMALEGMPRPVPTVRFLNCLIRGKGRCLWVTGGRGLTCEWTNSLFALQGPIYGAEGASRSAGGEGSLRWSHCTALLAGPLVELHGQPGGEMRAAGLPRLTVETEACLFVAAAGNVRPLVELHQVDIEARNLLSWQTRQTNRYANFDANAVTLLVRPPADAAMPREWDWDQWLVFAAEPPRPQKPLGNVAFAAYPHKVQELASLTPADLRLRSVQFPDLESPDPNLLAAGLLQPAELPEPVPLSDAPSPAPSADSTRDPQPPVPAP
ncbi:MAG: serine/threonine-protein kinase [Thermogemmata sp.]